jgi:hypothetical protein
MSNPLESGASPKRPSYEEIARKANKLITHIDDRDNQDMWLAHLEAVVNDLYSLSEGANPHAEEFGDMASIYSGYLSEDYATLLEELIRLDPSIARHIQEIKKKDKDQ